jgi:hypothetical protein
MNSIDTANDEDIVYPKEQKLREVVSSRIHSLTTSLQQPNEEISSMRYKLSVLEQNFRYNLQLLRGRDEEQVTEMENVMRGMLIHGTETRMDE